jgi:hypothetical protein
MMREGYSIDPLLDMRIHDINVEAEIIRSIPQIPVPVEADGTNEGLLESSDESSATKVDDVSSSIMDWLESWWDLVNFWPTLFIAIIETTLEATYHILVTTDLIGNAKTERMEVHCLAADGLSDNELSQITGIHTERAVMAAVYLAEATLAVGLMVLFNILRDCSWSVPQFVAGLILWWIAFGAYIALVDYMFTSGMETAIECWIAIMSLYVSLILASAFLPGLVTGFRLFWAVTINPVFIAVLLVMTKQTTNIFNVIKTGWNFLLTVSLIIAVAILSYWAAKYFTEFLIWLYGG